MHSNYNRYIGTAHTQLRSMGTSKITTWAFIIILNFTLIFAPLSLHTMAEEKDAEIEPLTLPAYHKLSNEELLKQTQSLFHESLSTFHAHMRGLKNSALLLEDARTESDNFRLPLMPINTADKTSPLEYAKLETQRVEVRLEAYKQQLALIQTEQTLLEKNIEFIELAQTAIKSLEDTLDTIKISLHEIDLRIQDNTLELDKIPEHLQDYKSETLRKRLESEKQELKSSLEASKTEFAVNIERINEAKEVVAVIETLYNSTEAHYAQELQRQDLLKAYAGQKPEALLAKLEQLHDEMTGLQGSLHISHRRFRQAQTDVEQTQSLIDPNKAPADQLPQPGVAVGPEEAKQVTQQADAIVAYHTERIKHLQELEHGLDRLIKTGEVLHGDAVVFNDHIFRMRLLVEIVDDAVKNGSLEQDKVPETFRVASLSAAHAPAAGYATASTAAVTEAKEGRGHAAREIEKSQTASAEVRKQLEHWQNIIALAEKARKWEQALKDLTAEQVAARFQETAQQSQTAEQSLKQAREAFDETKAKADEEREKFDSLTDPLLRLAKQESVLEKSNIIKKTLWLCRSRSPD